MTPPPAAAPTDPASPRWWSPALLAATCGGVGRIPFAPGTCGAALGLPLAWAVGSFAAWISASTGFPNRGVEAALLALACMAAVPICTRAARLLDRGHDPGSIVLDELLAVPLVLLAVPAGDRTPAVLAAAFILFRIFDIGKPFPCRQLERLPAGLGIMADDWAAAGWAAGCLLLAKGQGWL